MKDTAELIRSGGAETLSGRLRMTLALSLPSVMGQLSTILMEYIDASMVGSLGADASASIGLVSTTTWLFWGIGGAFATGFSVQVAHLVGAGRDDGARRLIGQAFTGMIAMALFLAFTGWGISPYLPRWLGGNDAICGDASAYFRIFAWSFPLLLLNYLAASLLRCSGNTLVPGMLNVCMCLLDVVFNWFLIFPTRELTFFNYDITMPGAALGVPGAATGTAAAEAVTLVVMLWYLFRRSPRLRLTRATLTLLPRMDTLRRAMKISLPMGSEHAIMSGAQILLTVIVAPLGTVAIAANAFAITAESLCYTPGFGMSDAATTLVGQTIGAGRRDLTRRFARITVGMGVLFMTLMGIALYVCAPLLMSMFTPVEEVRALGVEVLRIEAFAEPMYAVSIVVYGVFVGAGDTLIPSMMNLASIWGVRIPLAAWLAGTMGLKGVWLAMCLELVFRGVIFGVRMMRGRWIKDATNMSEPQIEQSDNPVDEYEM